MGKMRIKAVICRNTGENNKTRYFRTCRLCYARNSLKIFEAGSSCDTSFYNLIGPMTLPARSSSLAATWAACFSHMLTRVIWSGRLVLVVELDEFEAALDSAFPMIRLSCSTRTFRGAPPCGCSCGTAPLADPEIQISS